VLGGFELDDGQQRLTRLRSRAAMVLAWRLAMVPGREHPREELVSLLWPEVDATTGRNRLRQTFSLLRAALEPPGGAALFDADRRSLRCRPGTFWCDAHAFERAVRDGRDAEAWALWGGELLPGFYDECVLEEHGRLLALAERVQARLADEGSARAVERSPAPARSAPAALDGSLPAPPRAVAEAPPAARLPQYLTRLVGADLAGARLQAQVAEHRLVTVLGAGGSGKTRLAVEVARGLAEGIPGRPRPRFERAVFVALAGAVRPQDLLDRLTLALRLPRGGDDLDRVADALAGRHVLLLLDNAEPLDDEAVAVIGRLAGALPAAHWLVTSRRPLGLDGERRFVLGPLDLPPPGASAAEVAMNPAVVLFVDRARAHQPEFRVAASNAEAVAALVRWLDGLPLAIELAAAHVRTLRPSQLLAVLRSARAEALAGRAGPAEPGTPGGGGSLAMLTRRGPRSGHDPRHASMAAVMHSSWQLLDAAQRSLLTAVSVLPAGATLALAAAIAAATAAEEGAPAAGIGATQACLGELVEQCVLHAATGHDGEWRWLPAEAMREFVLMQSGPPALGRHRLRALRSLLAWARALPATPALAAVRDEMPNVTAVLQGAAADGGADEALELVLALQSAWGEMAVPAAVLDAACALLDTRGAGSRFAAAGHALVATILHDAGRVDDARRHREQALATPGDEPALVAMVLSRCARLCWRADRDATRARALVERGLPIARAAGRPNTEASMLSLLGHLATQVEGDAGRGRELSAQALALWARSGNRHLVNNGRYNVAVQTMEAGRPAAVLAEFDALAAEGIALEDWDLAAGAFEARGTALLRLRRFDESLASQRRALELAWSHFELTGALHALWNIAPALARTGRAELAAAAMGAADVQFRQRFGAHGARDERDLRRLRRFARVRLGPALAEARWREGAAMTLAEAVRRVLDGTAPPRG
jgi:predicted ATPase/tetratricopeptide (TPR) repeat protein